MHLTALAHHFKMWITQKDEVRKLRPAITGRFSIFTTALLR